ncbi:MAG: S9 family peptidase [Rhodanobacteraceae bacterium]|nr:S9 family peptidase [Rhodanobacteraceae bacterium]
MPGVDSIKLLLAAALVFMSCAARGDPLAAIRAAQSSQPQAATLPREAFLGQSSLREVRLAPDGRQVAFLRELNGQRGLWLQPLDEPTPRRVLPKVDADSLLWSRDSQRLFLVSADQLSVFKVDGQTGSGRIARLGQRVLHEVVGIDPSQPAALLVLEQSLPGAAKPWSRLLRIDADGAQTVLHSDTLPLGDAALSADGSVLYLRRIEAERHTILRLRPGGTPIEVARCVQLERCQFIGVTGPDHALWMNSDRGSNLSALQRLGSDGESVVLHLDPRQEADLDRVVADPVSGEPLLAAYRGSVPQVHGLSAEATRNLAGLQARLPDRDLDIQVGHGADAFWLVAERDSRLPQPLWHVFDPHSGELRQILENDAGPQAPDPAQLARKWPITWTASDGMRLHGFLSLPPGRDPRSLPLVVSVHGGPWTASLPGYAAITQFLANRGYAVFEPNFRGSTGLGRDYLMAANGDFGNGRVQQDIVEGTRYVLDNGIGDRARVAIQGASFGGYAALQGVTFQPELYRVAIAGVPPTDFGWALRWAVTQSDLADQRGTPLATRFRLLSVDPEDDEVRARLAAQSPLANVELLRRPVVLYAGGRDERVAIRSVTHYAATLRSLGKSVQLHVEADGGHDLDEPLAREAWLFLLEQALHEHLDGPPPDPASPSLRAWLEQTRRPIPVRSEQAQLGALHATKVNSADCESAIRIVCRSPGQAAIYNWSRRRCNNQPTGTHSARNTSAGPVSLTGEA